MSYPTAEHSERRRSYITTDRVLQTFGGILLLIVSAIAGWSLTRTFDHEGRIIRVETQTTETEKKFNEIKEDLKEIKQELKKKP